MRIRAHVAAAAAAALFGPALAAGAFVEPVQTGSRAPAHAPGPVRDTLHGIEVADPYRWLERTASAETRGFFRAQAEHARAQLDRIPGRADLLQRIRSLSEWSTAVTHLAIEGGRVFYLKVAPGLVRPVLCVREGFTGAERVLVDPARFDQGGSHAGLDWYVASPDGRHVAYGVSRGGSEDSVLRVLEVASGADLPLALDRGRFNAGLAWHPDGRSFYYTRIPEASEDRHRYSNIRVYRHVLGRETDKDEIVFAPGVGGARDVPEIVFPSLVVPLESRFAYAIAREGVRREVAVHVTEQKLLAAGRPRWTKVAGFEHEVVAIEAWKDDLYLLTHHGAPHYKVLALKADRPDFARARVVVPEGEAVLQSMALARDALYLRTMVGGIDRLERVPLGLLGAKRPEFVKTAFDTQIAQMVASPRRPGIVMAIQGWTEPPAIVEVDARTGDLRNTRLQPAPTANYAEIDEVRLYAPAHDGTKIPVTLLYRKSTTLTGENPTLLAGYGAHGIAMRPNFDATRLAWLERGGIIAIAHVRGGGEYGVDWHRAGRLGTKENTVLDFIAVAEFIARYGFTNPKRLAIEASSAGGIPAGGALVRRPELFAAVVPRGAVMDLLRYEVTAEGPTNVPEFGTVATREGFDTLRRISPYHQVKDGTAYPAVLLTTGMNDARVEPWQPAKMAARLQDASSSGRPVLLRVDFEGGHAGAAGRRQREEEIADIYSFLLWQFGHPDFQPPAEGVTRAAFIPGTSAPSAASDATIQAR